MVMFSANLSVRDKTLKEDIYVVKGLERPLLGRGATEKLSLISRIHTLSSEEYEAKVVSTHPELFKGLGQMEEELKLKESKTICNHCSQESAPPSS